MQNCLDVKFAIFNYKFEIAYFKFINLRFGFYVIYCYLCKSILNLQFQQWRNKMWLFV